MGQRSACRGDCCALLPLRWVVAARAVNRPVHQVRHRGPRKPSRWPSIQIKKWPPEILQAYQKARNGIVADEVAANPNFKKVYDSYSVFRENYGIWREYGYLQ